VVRARPKTRNPTPCEPLPVGVDRVVTSAHRRSTRRRRSTPTSARGTPRASPRCSRYAPLPARRRALWRTRSARASMRRGRLCAAAPPMRARVRTRAGTRLRGATGVGTAARRGRSTHASEYIYLFVCVCVFQAYTYMIHSFVCVRIGRRYVCVHQCAIGMDRLCAHALAGSCCGLGLQPETVRALARRRRPRAASAHRRSSRRRRSTPTSARGTPCPSPTCPWYAPLPARRRALWLTRSARASMRHGPLCAAAPPMRARVRHGARRGLGVPLSASTARSICIRDARQFVRVRVGAVCACSRVCVCMCVCVFEGVRVYVCVSAHVRVYARPRTARLCVRAETCELLPSAWTARGLARRRSTMRRRSTRTSPRGTYYV
jgi:hypothetical protein